MSKVRDVEYLAGADPGAFCIRSMKDEPEKKVMWLKLPNGVVCQLHLLPSDADQAWEFDGDEKNPTLTPAIRHTVQGGVEAWHGYVRSGKLESLV